MGGREHVIVCGADGSAASQRALEWAIDEAVRGGCSLRVVTAWSWDGVEDLGAAYSASDALNRAAAIQKDAVDSAMASVEKTTDVERLLPRGTPSQALCEAATDAELLVIGSHGHGQVHDKIIGSTSQRVIYHASCPVVVLPDPRHAARERSKRKGTEPSLAPLQRLTGTS